MRIGIEQWTEQFRDMVKEIDVIATELEASGREDAFKAGAVTRLQALSRHVLDLSAGIAADLPVDIARHGGALEALAASERQFRSLAENLPDNIARWDCSGHYLYINPTHERTLGKPAAEVIGTRISALYAHVAAAIAHVVATGEGLPFVRETGRDDKGGVTTHEISLVPERDAQNQIISVLGIGRDVTRQVQTEEALAASERHFRTLAENMPNYLARHSTRAELVYMNPRLAAFLGRGLHELAGKTPMQLYPDGGYEEYESAILETASTGIERKLELCITVEGGQQVVHHVHLVAECDETGAVTSVLTIAYDITERRQAEIALKRALDFTEGVIAAIPDVLFEVDAEGRYLNVWTRNPDLLASPAQTLIGSTVHEVLAPQQAEAAMQAIREADRQGGTYGHTIPIDLPDGSRRWFEHSLAKKKGETRTTDTFLVLSRDVTSRMRTEQALDAAHARLVSVLQTIPDMIWMKDADGRYLSCNHAFERLVGKRGPDIIGKTDYDLFDVELAEFFGEKDRSAIEARRICFNEEWVSYADTGERALLETRKVPVLDAAGNVTGVLGLARDMTERKRIEERLARREQEFRTLVENSPDVIMRYGRDLRRLYVNPAFAALVEGGVSAAIGGKPREVPGAQHAIEYEQKLETVFRSGKEVEFEWRWATGSAGKAVCYLIKLVPERDSDGTVESILAVGRDITELHASREKIHQMALYDSLTSLPNRALFKERLRQSIADAAGRSQLTGMMMIDLDRFKGVNDTMGHAVGDELLREAAARLLTCVRACDTVARFGGDEFAILLPELRDRCVLEDIARTIIDRFDERFTLDGKEVFVSCSIGIALYPVDSVDAEDLMKYADSAMYLAKRSGRRGFRFYSKDLTALATARLLLESELRGAVERGELELHYQPKVSLRGVEVIGSEALLRWRRPGVGLVPPDQFIPVAEETGLIKELGTWVLREACRTAAGWNAEGKAPHKVAVNLSARQFQSHDLASTVMEILVETGCRAEWLELEITESILLEEDHTILRTLSAFKSMGLSIAIDDFGTGYSALGYLARYPIDTLKIDRSFVQKVTTDRRHAELVKAILSIAGCLGQQVVAEGVETTDQAAFLESNGCQFAQGFLYCKPLTKPDMDSLSRFL